jgi:uncharacterized membrane protein SpoIIM required for sporulation
MHEALFIRQNSAKWKAYEDLQGAGPDELAGAFISVTDDLAYAKTFYPNSKTTKYLNGLAASFHQSIYKNRKEKANRFFTFWQYELPLMFFKHRKLLLYSFLFFMVFSLMGALSARYDNTFIRLVLGNDYVNMTNENIAKGDPFGVYKQGDSPLMFLSIAANNIRVELFTFVMGVFLSVGSIYMIMYNGVMMGSFQYYLFSKGVGWQSVLVIWLHGTLEISAIIIAGGAGMVLGNSFLFPGTYKRLVSLKNGARDGLIIAMGLVPVFLTAAFIEGFITRHTEMPAWLSLAVIILSLSFIIWYVILYPKYLNQKLNPKIITDETTY